jgi:hypothetical protein
VKNAIELFYCWGDRKKMYENQNARYHNIVWKSIFCITVERRIEWKVHSILFLILECKKQIMFYL